MKTTTIFLPALLLMFWTLTVLLLVPLLLVVPPVPELAAEIAAQTATLREQLQRMTAGATMLVAVVTRATNNALVVAQAGAVFGEHRLHPLNGHRAGPAQIVAPVATAVAG